MVNEQTNITTIAQKFELQESQTKPLLDNFGDYFIQAHKLVTKGKGIKVTQEDQVEEMQKAREIRLELRALRVNANETRTTLKEGYLRGGNAVQAIYNDIIDIIKPEEDRLKEQEQFALLKQQERAEKKYSERLEKLSKWVDDTSVYNLREASDESFESLLKIAKQQYEERVRAEEEVEKARIKEELAEKKRQEKIQAENKKLKAKAEAQAKKLREEEEARKKVELELQKVKEEKEAEERQERELAEKKRKEEEDARTKALLAPDKEKLGKFIETISIETVPSFDNPKITKYVLDMITEMNTTIQKLTEFHDAL